MGQTMSIQQGDSLGVARLLTAMQQVYQSMGDIPKAESYNRRALRISQTANDKKNTGIARINIGNLHVKQGLYVQAIEQFSKSLKIGEELGDAQLKALAYHNMGVANEEKGNYDTAIIYYNQSLTLKESLGEDLSTGSTLMNIGIVYAKQDKYTQAQEYLMRSLAIYEKLNEKRRLSQILHNIGSLYKRQGNNKEAIRYFMRARKVFEELGDKRSLAYSYIGLGTLCVRIDEREKALGFYVKSRDLCTEIGDKRGLANALYGIGNIYKDRGSNDLAIQKYTESLNIFKKILDQRGEGRSLAAIGQVYMNMDHNEKALGFFFESLEIDKRIKAASGIANNLNYIGAAYRRQKKYSRSISHSLQALAMAQEIDDFSGIQGGAYSLCLCYKALGQHQKALEMHELYAQAKDSLETQKYAREVLHQQYQYEYQQKALTDSLAFVQQQAEQKIEYQTQLIRRNYLLYGAIVFALLSLLFLRYRQRRKAREKALILDQQRAEAQRLRELNELKTRLYNNITHEFRTPLTVIQGMTEEARGYFEQGDIAHFELAMSMIQRNGGSLLHLINQMLDLAKLESGSLNIRYVHGDVISYLSYICESFHSYAESQNIQLTIYKETTHLEMDHDPIRLLSIVSNLLSNAIKFTPAGGKVIFHVSKENDQLQIKVQDNGRGITQEALPHVFDRFFQVDQKQHTDGTGIGMALVKELCQAMGGEVSVESQAGKGSTFRLLLPIRKTAQAIVAKGDKEEIKKQVLPFTEITQSRTHTHPPEAEAMPLVLIVEDNPDVQHYLQQCLYGNFRCIIANDGQEGIEQALAEVPDLIVSDVMMPRKDGFELCETLKQDPRTSHIPIIILTARASVEDRVAGLRKGADSYLAKPFNREELRVSIRNLIALRQSLQQRYAGGDISLSVSAEADLDIKMEDTFVIRIRDYVLAQLDNSDLSIEAICVEIGMSRTQLHRKLKALTGLSASRYVRSIRLSEARKLLLQPELSISDIAYQCGFSDPAYFSRVFSKAFGESPTKFREELSSSIRTDP